MIYWTGKTRSRFRQANQIKSTNWKWNLHKQTKSMAWKHVVACEYNGNVKCENLREWIKKNLRCSQCAPYGRTLAVFNTLINTKFVWGRHLVLPMVISISPLSKEKVGKKVFCPLLSIKFLEIDMSCVFLNAAERPPYWCPLIFDVRPPWKLGVVCGFWPFPTFSNT